MLIPLKNYLAEQGQASLDELSKHFKSSPDALRGMLSHWLKKGRIRKEALGCNKGCASCPPEQTEIYCWLGSRATQPEQIPHRQLT